MENYWIWYLMFIGGLYCCGSFAWYIIKILYIRLFIYKSIPTALKHYASNSWAVVTGASRGIGLAYCEELAAQKFNIIMIARSVSAMQNNAKMLCSKFGIKCEVLEADLGDEKQLNKITNFLQEKDIGIFVNNAGVMYICDYKSISYEKLSNIIEVNVRSSIKLITWMLEKFSKKHSKTAVIVVSSMTSEIPFPYLNLYSPSKAFLSKYLNDLFNKYNQYNIDHLLVEFGAVATDMVPVCEIPGIIIDPRSSVRASLQALGNNNCCSGTFFHDLQSYLLLSFPINKMIGILAWIGNLFYNSKHKKIEQDNKNEISDYISLFLSILFVMQKVFLITFFNNNLLLYHMIILLFPIISYYI